MDSLFDDDEPSVPDRVLQNLLIKPDESAEQVPNEPVAKAIIPEPGFCMKTKHDKGEKVFINICKSDQIPSPRAITDEQLSTLLESGDPTQYRVPLSLGEPHTEKDNAGKDCQTYDVVISSQFYETIQQRPVMKDFLLTVVLEGLEDKYSMLLSRECKLMKNRKFMGSLPEQTVRQKPKPFIIEMDSQETNAGKKKKSLRVSEVQEEPERAVPEPVYTILREPVEGEVPDFLVMEVQLPGIVSSKHLLLEVGEDRVVLKSRPQLFLLDIDLPYLVDNEDAGAQFDRQRQVLTVTLPVTGKAPV